VTVATYPTYPPPRVASLSRSINDFLRPLRRGPALIALLAALGACMGAMTALVLFATKPLIVALPIAGLLVVMPTFVIRDKRMYWLGVFLFTVQFEISKNLNDGLAVIDRLNIDYTLWHFTFQVHATDLILLVLLFYWYAETVFKGQRPYFPRATWLLVGFLGFCLLSLVAAPSPYLGLVETWRQLKFFLVFLYVVNNVNNKATLRLLAIMAVAILTIQGAVTVARYETGWMKPLAFGDSQQDEDRTLLYLSVDRDEIGEQVRSFGTLGSPGSTLRLCLMVIPFALLLSMRNPVFSHRLLYLGLTAFGMGSLLLTFTRAYLPTTAVQLAAAFVIGIRHRYLSRLEVLLLVVVGVAGLSAVAPKIYEQLAVRQDSVTVRLEQYKTAIAMIVDNPVFGVGLNNGTGVKEAYVNVSYDKYDPDTQYYLEPTHNLYLSLTSEIGLIGSMLYFAFFANVIARAWRVSSTADPELRFFANVLLIAFVGVFANSLYDPMHEDAPMTLLWMYCGIAFALTRMAELGPDQRDNALAAVSADPSGLSRVRVGSRRAR
jgi:O-antigen ligase